MVISASFKGLQQKAAISTAPFWQPASDLRRAFGWLGLPYGAITSRRMAKIGAEAVPVPVICVGNFVVGGAGKTPVSLAVAAHLAAADMRPIFLTRGYRGRLSGPLLVDELGHSHLDVGDEPLLLAAQHLTVMSTDRPRGAALAVWLGADAVVMDDGLQNPSLKKDLRLAVIDGQVGVGNGLVLPVGPLRAPLVDQLCHVDALVVLNYSPAARPVVRFAARRGLPVLSAKSELIGAEQVADRRVLAFAGLGRPQKFFDSLRGAGAAVIEERSFPDHHVYGEGDAKNLLRLAADQKLLLATTAKDAVRLQSVPSNMPASNARASALKDLLAATVILDVKARFCEPMRLEALLRPLNPRQQVFHKKPSPMR